MTRRYADDDDERIVRDGEAVHVPLTMMDSMQKQVARDAKRRKTVQYDPQGRVRSTYEEEEEADAAFSDAQLAMHKPGYRTSTAVNDAAAHTAYDEYVRNLGDAWRSCDAQPMGALRYEPGREGQGCTINGAPGTLQRRGDWLVCVPTTNSNSDAVPRALDAVDAQRIRDAAWQEYCERTRNAWRTPA
jgi:hypothetical protein